MKIVRKLLRLLPFIVMFGYFLILILNINQMHLQEPTIYYFDNFYDYYFDELPMMGFDNISVWFTENLGIDNRISQWAMWVLSYELYLSLAFLFVDVFNFIIGIASNWLRKGEKLNE